MNRITAISDPGDAAKARPSFDILKSYTADGYLEKTRIAQGTYVNGTYAPPSGTGATRTIDTRDAMGRVLTHTEYTTAGAVAYSRTAAYNKIGQVTSDSTSGTSGTSATTYKYTATTFPGSIVPGTYANGAVVSQSGSSTVSGQTTYSTVTNTYVWRDGPLQKVISNAQSGAVNGTTTSTFSYNANGHLSAVDITGQQARKIAFTTASSGQIMVRSQTTNGSANSPRQFYFYFNGARIGEIGNNGTDNVDYGLTIARNGAPDGTGPFREGAATGTAYADFDSNYQAINTGSGAEAGSALSPNPLQRLAGG